MLSSTLTDYKDECHIPANSPECTVFTQETNLILRKYILMY